MTLTIEEFESACKKSAELDEGLLEEFLKLFFMTLSITEERWM